VAFLVAMQNVKSVMEVHHSFFYVSLGHMQNSMRSSVTLKLKLTLTLTLTLTDTGGAVLLLGYRPGGAKHTVGTKSCNNVLADVVLSCYRST